jgi:uncharacterized protein (DUF927 family)
LGLIGAAGELAREWGIVPWVEGEALNAARHALAAWIACRGGVTAAEEREAIRRVRGFIEANGEARFECLDKETGKSIDQDVSRVLNRAGYRRGYGPDREWLILYQGRWHLTLWAIPLAREA